MRVIIAENCSEARQALAALLNEQPGIEMIGEAAEVGELLDLIQNQPVEVIMLEYGLPGMTLDGLIDQIRKVSLVSRVFVLSSDSEKAKYAFSAGADAFIDRGGQSDWLLEVLHRLDSNTTSSGTTSGD